MRNQRLCSWKVVILLWVLPQHNVSIIRLDYYFMKFISFQQCMSKESRLCYHAVPKIMKTDVSWINAPFDENPENIIKTNVDHHDCDELEKSNNKKRRLNLIQNDDQKLYDDGFSENIWNIVIEKDYWKPFGDYILDCRINMNVRQVLDHGRQRLDSEWKLIKLLLSIWSWDFI